VLIARELAQEAPLIVMDEPTASLDFCNQLRVLAEIDALARDARDPVDPRPRPGHALEARILLMEDGGIYRRGSAEDALTEKALSAVYGLPVTVERTTSGRRVCVPSLRRQSTATMTSDAFITA
jgi:iron complex transport system ATP-binding protein